MNDKKLNEVKKVTDMAYVPVIMADGSVGQIAKADLATVVAELISSNAINIFYTTYNVSDFNDCVKTGIYEFVGYETQNGPETSAYGTLIVFHIDIPYSTTIQMFFSKKSGYAVYSRSSNGNWKAL